MSRPAGIHVLVRYRGVPAEGLLHGNNIHGERTIFANNWPNQSRHWLPMIDHPYDKATGEMIVTAPGHYQVVSNGVLIEESDRPNAMRLTHWKQSVPIASWLYTLGVARFTSHHAGAASGIPMQTWVFPQDRETGLRLFEDLSRRAINFFGRRSALPLREAGEYLGTGFSGGTEYASAIFYGEKASMPAAARWSMRFAHQWLAIPSPSATGRRVLSEGFATYFPLLFTEHDEGRDAFVEG